MRGPTLILVPRCAAVDAEGGLPLGKLSRRTAARRGGGANVREGERRAEGRERGKRKMEECQWPAAGLAGRGFDSASHLLQLYWLMASVYVPAKHWQRNR